MITTRQVDVILTKGRKFNRVTTKEIDASIKIEKPAIQTKPQSISTTSLPDVADIAERKRRDDIAAEKKREKIEKKPWNKMNAEERKEYQAEKARKKEEKK